MEIGTEISHKIRSAIKAKLVDLGAYVDDELPDYIMVMVANKKTKEQMADDLSLFLGNNTEKFTSWLHSLLTKLKAITSGNSADTRMEDLIKDEQPKADPVIVHEDAIQDRAKSQTGVSQTKKTTEINDALKEKGKQKKEKSVTSNKSAAPKDQKLEEPATDIVEVTIKDDEFREEEPKDSLHKSTQDKKQTKVSSKVLPTVQKAAPVRSVTSVAPAKVSAKAGASSRYTPKTSKVRPVVHAQRRSVVGTVVHHSEEEEDEEEYDPHNPAVGSVASVIRVTERKSSVPKSLQANKSLLLKAMTEAETSVTSKKAALRKPSIKPQYLEPFEDARSLLTRTVHQSEETRKTSHALVRPVQRSRGMQLYSKTRREELLQRLGASASSEEDQEKEVEFEVYPEMDSRIIKTYQPTRVHLPVDYSSDILNLNDSEDNSDVDRIGESDSIDRIPDNRKIINSPRSAGMTSPKFVVTLDGVNPSDLRHRRRGSYSDEEDMDSNEGGEVIIVEDSATKNLTSRKRPPVQGLSINLAADSDEDAVEEQENNTSPRKKMKPAERCKFWPTCKNGESCQYHHPKTQCKTFPKCKYGDKCLFVHPNCKFDANCSRSDCPFTHASKRSPVIPTVQQVVIAPPKFLFPTSHASIPPVPKGPKQITCKYIPNCTNVNCVFSHPKPCRFGISCNNKSQCAFTHPSLPTQDKLKWKAGT